MFEELMKEHPNNDVLVLGGKGVTIQAENRDYETEHAAITSDLHVTLNGNDITNRVKYSKEYVAFIANKILEQIPDATFYMSGTPDNPYELEPAVFLLPKGANPDLIELLPIDHDFGALYKDGTVADFIVYDGKVMDAHNSRELASSYWMDDREIIYLY